MHIMHFVPPLQKYVWHILHFLPFHNCSLNRPPSPTPYQSSKSLQQVIMSSSSYTTPSPPPFYSSDVSKASTSQPDLACIKEVINNPCDRPIKRSPTDSVVGNDDILAKALKNAEIPLEVS